MANKNESRQAAGEKPPTATPIIEKETPVSQVKVDSKLLPKKVGASIAHKKKVVSIGARWAMRKITQEEATDEMRSLLADEENLTATVNDLREFSAALVIRFRTMAVEVLPTVKNEKDS